MLLAHRYYFPRLYLCITLIFFSLYTYRGTHLPWGELILGHVDRGVADGVVSYVVLSQDGTHLGVNLPRLLVAMQEVPADAPSPYIQSDGAYTFIEVLTLHTRSCRRALSSWMRRFGARDISRVTYGTTGEVPEDTIRSRSLRVYEHCSALGIRVVEQCRLRVFFVSFRSSTILRKVGLHLTSYLLTVKIS